MPGPPAEPVTLSPRQEELFRAKLRARACPQGLAQRIQIVLQASLGRANEEIARGLATTAERVRRWRGRWKKRGSHLEEAEGSGVGDQELLSLMEQALRDSARPGAPPTFSAEQVAQIIAVACEKPEISGRPISHWSPRELADEVVKRGIVESISPRHVGRLLKRGRSAAAPDSVLDQQHREGPGVSRSRRGRLRRVSPGSRPCGARRPRSQHR